MRISRTTVFLLVANLIAFGLVWRATSGHQPAAASQTQLFPPDPGRITLTEGPARLVEILGAIEREFGYVRMALQNEVEAKSA